MLEISREKEPYLQLFEEFEKTRSRLFHVVTQEFINKQAAMPKELRRSEDMELKLPESTAQKYHLGV